MADLVLFLVLLARIVAISDLLGVGGSFNKKWQANAKLAGALVSKHLKV